MCLVEVGIGIQEQVNVFGEICVQYILVFFIVYMSFVLGVEFFQWLVRIGKQKGFVGCCFMWGDGVGIGVFFLIYFFINFFIENFIQWFINL